MVSGSPYGYPVFSATKGLPTRENCDLTNPYEMFLWMFVASPGLNGAPLMIPIDSFQLWSKRLHDLGAMLVCENCGHTKTPTLKYQRAAAGDPNPWTAPGRWVPVDTPDPDPNPVAVAADTLPTAQQIALFKELYRRHSPAQRRKMMADTETELDDDDQP